MSTAMTFDSLKDNVRSYLERGGSSSADPQVFDQIPMLIAGAERRIATELKVQGFVVPVTTELSANTSVYDKPDRWRHTVSVSIQKADGKRKHLLPRGYEFVRMYWPDADATGEPEYYADYDYGHWLIAPTPGAAYPVEIVYHELPEMLSDSVQTNWLTQHAPQLLLYATLLEAEPFLRNDERVALWQGFYDRAAAMLTGEDIAKIFDRTSVRKEA